MSFFIKILSPLALIVCTGCAAIGADRQSILEYQPNQSANLFTALFSNPCALGGVDELTRQHCAQVNNGRTGQMAALNRAAALLAKRGANCEAHTDAVLKLASSQKLKAEKFYSCPEPELARAGQCHVSALVTDASGEKWLLDNGTIVSAAHGPQGAARLQDLQHDLAKFPSGAGADGYQIVSSYVTSLLREDQLATMAFTKSLRRYQ